MNTGTLVISLDFELHWGVSDRRTIDSYRENLDNVPLVVNRLLDLFEKRGIHGTWATVGMLFCQRKEELFSYVKPENRPIYKNHRCSNYVVAEEAGENEKDDPYHYAPSLIRKIKSTPFQEIATHTFSHYYCLEPGQTQENFYYDLKAAIEVASRENIELKSIVFPANQFHPDYLQECKKNGITCYRGNFPSDIYSFQAKKLEGKGKRLARLIDTYLPLTGHRTVQPVMEDGILNIPASCFFRPYRPKLSLLEFLRIWRIKREMRSAAKNNKVYHMWWHPHNFGQNVNKNFLLLEQVLDYYSVLQKKYNMQSRTMSEIYHLFT